MSWLLTGSSTHNDVTTYVLEFYSAFFLKSLRFSKPTHYIQVQNDKTVVPHCILQKFRTKTLKCGELREYVTKDPIFLHSKISNGQNSLRKANSFRCTASTPHITQKNFFFFLENPDLIFELLIFENTPNTI